MNKDRSQLFTKDLYEQYKINGKLNRIETVFPDGLSYEQQIEWANSHTPRYETFQEWQKRMCRG